MNGQCKARDLHHGVSMRCEDIVGHRGVHYCGNHWWPNENGFPDDTAWDSHKVIGWLVMGTVVMAIVFAIIIWLIRS
jgi:hypothetical protein